MYYYSRSRPFFTLSYLWNIGTSLSFISQVYDYYRDSVDIVFGTLFQQFNTLDKVKENKDMERCCRVCGDGIAKGRTELGYRTCLVHGDLDAKARKFCVVPMHKSNYVAVFDRDLLTGVNQKGGVVK